MFLATTADQQFWNLGERTLFLGEWCKVYTQKNIWSRLDHEVIPYYGLDRRKAYRDYSYSQDLYEKILNELSQQMNDVHDVKYSVKYWRILMGHWLIGFIQICLDRYRSILQAKESGKVSNTWIYEYEPNIFIPKDFNEFHDFFLEDEYNHFLYSFFIRGLNGFPWEIKSGCYKKKSIAVQLRKKNNFKSFFMQAIGSGSKLIPDKMKSVVFFNSYLGVVNLARLQLALGQMPCPFWPTVEAGNPPINMRLRNKLCFIKQDGLFECLIKKLLHVQIPKVYIEGYREMNMKAESMFPKNPRVIVTATHKASEVFKFWAAYQVEKKTKIILTQHGGNQGDARWSTSDSHELAIASRYFTWGWSQKDISKTVDVPAVKLNKRKDQIRQNPKGNILCVAVSFPRYSYQSFSVPQGPLVLNTINIQNRFFKLVSEAVYKLFLLRLFPIERGWEEKERWADIQPSLKTYRGTKSMHSQLNQSRLCVCFYNGTPMLEIMAANFPLIILWDPAYCELNDSAQPYFDELREAGILFDNPESAASHVNEIYQDPMSWWKTKKIQKIRKRFCKQYVRFESDWVTIWKNEILKVVNE